MAAPGLWQQAMAFASGTEESLDDWLAPVAAAAGLLGRELSPAEADAVAGWLLGAAGWLPAAARRRVLGVALAQPDGTLADQRLLDLLDLAWRLPAPARVERLELLLAGRAVTASRPRRGRPCRSGSPARPRRPRGVQAAEVLAAATPATALAVLEWAAASEVVLPEAELERYGRTRLDPGTPEPELTRDRAARARPSCADCSTGWPASHRRWPRRCSPARSVTTSERSDLAAYPVADRAVAARVGGPRRMAPLEAFDEIADVRARAQRSPRVDAALLRRLWPDGCPPEQIAELLGAVTGAEPAPGVLDWFAAADRRPSPPRGAMNDGWLRLAQALAGHPVLGMLPEAGRADRCATRPGWSRCCARPARPGRRATWPSSPSCSPRTGRGRRHPQPAGPSTCPPLLSERRAAQRGPARLPGRRGGRLLPRARDRLAPPADVTLAGRVFMAIDRPGCGSPGLRSPTGWRRPSSRYAGGTAAISASWPARWRTTRSWRGCSRPGGTSAAGWPAGCSAGPGPRHRADGQTEA